MFWTACDCRDLVYVVNVALAAEYGTDAVLARDLRGFRTVRPLGGRRTRFRISPRISDRRVSR
ncbi:hypothetical protein GCM10010306_020570 [Streptomyces umbrinus]|nr:hypothetical protein GCM10010306_020570 [Streptomyces umbrinus]